MESATVAREEVERSEMGMFEEAGASNPINHPAVAVNIGEGDPREILERVLAVGGGVFQVIVPAGSYEEQERLLTLLGEEQGLEVTSVN
jgi:hypothetical protein